jgi:hypothetical protein
MANGSSSFRDPDLGVVITYSPWQWTGTGKMTKIPFHLFAHPNRKLNWIYFNDSKRQCKAIQTTEFELGPMQYHNGFDIETNSMQMPSISTSKRSLS